MYADENAAVNGQAIKTRNYLEMLRKKYGDENVAVLDTNYFRKHLSANYKTVFELCRKSDVIIIMPTRNGLKLLLPILRLLKKRYHFKILYPVIGGWLPDVVDEVGFLRDYLHCVDAIYLETDSLTNEMRKRGFSTAKTVANFSLRLGDIQQWKYLDKRTLCRCFTFSRVTRTKGINEAIEAIYILNNKHSKMHYTLDIYGPLDEAYKEEFSQKLRENSESVRYGGVLMGNSILPVLSNHELMLFPTYYDGEGMPGAVIESFMAGIPVIASDWHNNSEVVKNAYTGVIYQLGDISKLIAAIQSVTEQDGELNRMHDNCMKESKKYQPKTIMQTVFDDIDSGDKI